MYEVRSIWQWTLLMPAKEADLFFYVTTEQLSAALIAIVFTVYKSCVT